MPNLEEPNWEEFPKNKTDIEPLICNFAYGNREISGVCRGNCPEKGNRVYWLLTGDNTRIDFSLMGRVTDYIKELRERYNPNLNISPWPRSPENLKESFLGELIWKRK